jgi:hypothetical protein
MAGPGRDSVNALKQLQAESDDQERRKADAAFASPRPPPELNSPPSRGPA